MEEELRVAVAETLESVERIEEILFTALIRPAGRDPETRERLYRFAHQSFFDWFLARGLIQSDRQSELNGHRNTVRAFG